MEYSKELQEAFNLPTADYLPFSDRMVNSENIKLMGMSTPASSGVEDLFIGVTNSTSQFPMVGTGGFSVCTCLVVYNENTKKAALIHHPEADGETVIQLISMVRNDEKDKVSIHVMGAAEWHLEDLWDDSEELDEGPEKDAARERLYLEYNEPLLQRLDSIVSEVAQLPNTELRTFDVYHKLKPTDVAFDTRNGKLILCCSELYLSAPDDYGTPNSLLDSNMEEIYGMFDGTATELQVRRRD